MPLNFGTGGNFGTGVNTRSQTYRQGRAGPGGAPFQSMSRGLAAAVPDPFQASLDPFRQALEQYSPRFFEAANALQNVATGASDPAFLEYQRAQQNILRQNALMQGAAQEESFGRRGLGGSSAAMDAQTRLMGGLQQQEQALGAQLGLQGLQRRDQALMQQFEPLTAGLEALTTLPQLQISQQAAEAAGRQPTSSGGGGLLSMFGL